MNRQGIWRRCCGLRTPKDELEGKKPAPETPKAEPKPKAEPENESWRGKSLGKEEIEKARARYEENADENGDNDPALREASIWIGDEEGNMIGRIDERHTDNEQDVTDVIEYLVDEARQVFGKEIDWTNTDLMVVDKNGNVMRRVKFDEDGNYSEDDATEPQDDEGEDYEPNTEMDRKLKESVDKAKAKLEAAYSRAMSGPIVTEAQALAWLRERSKVHISGLRALTREKLPRNASMHGGGSGPGMMKHDYGRLGKYWYNVYWNDYGMDATGILITLQEQPFRDRDGLSEAFHSGAIGVDRKTGEIHIFAYEDPAPKTPGGKLKDAATKKAGEKKATAAKAEEKLAPKPKAEKGPTAASTAAKLAEEDGIYLRPGEVPVEVHGDDPDRRVYIVTHRTGKTTSGIQVYQLVVNLPIGGNKRIMKQIQGTQDVYYGIEKAKAAVQVFMDKQAEIDAEAMPDMPTVPAKLTDGKFTETVIEISVRGKGKEMVKRPSRAFVYGNSGLALTGGMGQDGNNMGWAITHMRSGYQIGVSGTSIKAGKDLLVKVAALTDWTVDMMAMPKKNPELWQKIGNAVREIRDGGNPGPLAARAGAAAPGIMAQKSKEVDVSKRKATQRHRHPTPDRDAVIAEFGWTVATQAELDAAMSEKNVKALLRIADLVGLDIEFYSGKMNGTEGFYHPYDLSVAIHVQCSQPIGYVIAHELGHYLHLHARKEMALLADRVELLDQPSRAKMTALLRFYHPTKLTREVMADIAADQMINNDGIRFLLAQLEPSVQLRIRNKVIMGLRAIAKKLKIAAAGTTHMEGLESLERRVEDSYRDVLRGVVIPRRKRLPPGYMPSSDQAALFSLQPFDPSQPPPSMKPIQAARVKPKQINPRYKPVTKRRTTKIRRHPDWVPEDTKRDIDGYYRARRKLTGPAAKDGLWQWGRHWLSRENMEKWYGRIFNYMHMAQLSVDRATAQMQDSMKQMGLPAAFIPAKRIDRAISNDVIRMGQLYNGWGGAVKMFFEKGITELDDSSKKINQIGLLQILMDKNYEIAGNYDYFNQYLIDRQILEVERAKKANGETFINWKNPLHVERYKQAQANVAACEGKFQLWSTAADEITSWMNDLLEYSYRAGVMSKEQRDHVKSMYQSYVPLHLMSGWDPRSAINATGQNVKAKHLLDNMGLLKEGEFIIPPIEACLNNAAYLVRATMMAKQSARMAETVDKLSEISKDAEKITGREWLGNQKAPDRHPTSITRGELLDAAGVPTGDAAAEVLIDNPQGDPIGDHYGPFEIDQVVSTFGLSEAQRDTMAQLWIVSGVQSPGTISFIRNGKVVYYEVNEHIWAMFSGQGHGSHDVAVSALGTMARLQRLGATSYSPKFPFRNMFRDVGQALVTSQHLINIQKGPIRAVTDLVMMGPRLLNAMFQMGKVQAGLRSEIYEEAMRNYAFYSDLFSMDLESSEKRALKIVQMSGSGKPIRNKTGTKLEQQMIDLFEATEGERNYLVKHPLVAMTLFASNLESATRLAVYKKTRNDLYATKKMDAKDARLEAGLNAREASTDFQRRGTSLPTMGVMWSFLHAGLQGMDLSRRVLFSRSVKNKRYNWVMAFLTITLHSLANWWANKDEEWYQKANRWQKDMFWIWSPDHGETRYMVPKPFQLGYFFGTIWEHALQKISDKDPKAFDRLGPELLSMINPFQATAVAPMLVAGAEMAANYSLFRGGKIVSSSQEKIISEYQYHVRTSLMARKLASLLDHAPVPEHFKSPVLLDHWARSSFGAAADYVQALTDVLIRASDPQMRRTKPAVPKLFNVIASDWPLALNAMIEVGEPATTRYMADLFDMTERARTVKATFDRATNGQLDQMALAEILEDDLPYLAMYDQLAATVAMSTQIIGAIKTIEMEGFGAYTPTQKRDEIERLQRYMHLTVEAVVTELYTAEKEGQEYVDRMSPQIRAFRESIRRARSQQ
ncbi:MAG: hypothetical protein IPO08_20205 [Xanthomonadales bacterium]|nr:hypothetical protein [Xanthomonadales bacterium]